MSDPVDLRALPIRRMVPRPYRLGATVRGALGGAQTIARLGDRWSWTIETPPMDMEPDGRRWGVLIDDAERRGALLRIDQPDLRVGPVGTPVVRTATAAGRTIPVGGMLVGAAIRAGQWVSVIVEGQRYLDRVVAPATARVDGTVDLTIKNLLRRALPAGATVELAVPCVQGTIEGDVGGAWEVDGTTSFAFTLTEDA